MKENQIQNRLLQWEHIRTPGVFQIDDDLLIDPEDVRLAFYIWKGDPDRLVGFSARNHYKTSSGKYAVLVYFTYSTLFSQCLLFWNPIGKLVYSFNPKDEFSIVIGSALFVHRRFYELYSSQDPKMIKGIKKGTLEIEERFEVNHLVLSNWF